MRCTHLADIIRTITQDCIHSLQHTEHHKAVRNSMYMLPELLAIPIPSRYSRRNVRIPALRGTYLCTIEWVGRSMYACMYVSAALVCKIPVLITGLYTTCTYLQLRRNWHVGSPAVALAPGTPRVSPPSGFLRYLTDDDRGDHDDFCSSQTFNC